MSEKLRQGPVLIVDDDPTIVELVDMALSDCGFRCVSASDGREATERVRQARPALILLDISMPVMDGKEFYSWLRSNGQANTPVIVMTAGSNAAKTCREMGAQDYIAKPFDLADLFSQVDRWVQAGC